MSRGPEVGEEVHDKVLQPSLDALFDMGLDEDHH